MKNNMMARIIAALIRSALGAVTWGFGTMPASAANLTRSDRSQRHACIIVAASARWQRHQGLAAAGRHVHRRRQVATDPTLITRDGKASFVETPRPRATRRSTGHSYAFLASPLPVTNYKSTIGEFAAKGDGMIPS